MLKQIATYFKYKNICNNNIFIGIIPNTPKCLVGVRDEGGNYCSKNNIGEQTIEIVIRGDFNEVEKYSVEVENALNGFSGYLYEDSDYIVISFIQDYSMYIDYSNQYIKTCKYKVSYSKTHK